GRQKGHSELYRGAEYNVNFLPKIKIDIATNNERVEEIIHIIQQTAFTGKMGDGKIFVFELQHAVRIRTGETNDLAL
ncbi:P-II family nitrogen regulator, partial [Xenorhabdus bovienii]|uniref:P-II family nitrogen regulator n=1 Tax=Xenorhabdus bovienii TaxID=40576 RepID=UPI0023B32D79